MDGNPWATFLKWEGASRDTVDFKMIYVDMAGDLVAGLLLSQIIYWYLPSKKGQSKLRVFKDGFYWIAKARHEWWDEIRLKPRQIDRAVAILEKKGIIATHLYRFNNAPTSHLRIDKDGFLNAWDVALARFNETGKSEPPSDPFSPNLQLDLTDSSNADDETVKSDLPESVESLTETTIDFSEITAENTSDFSQKPKADPLLLEQERITVAARAQGSGNYAEPTTDALVDAAITCLCEGNGPKKGSGTWHDMANTIKPIHADWGLHDEEVSKALAIVRAAIALFLEEKQQMAIYKYPSFAANYGQYLGRAMNGDTGEPSPRPRNDPDKFDRARAMTLERLEQHGNR